MAKYTEVFSVRVSSDNKETLEQIAAHWDTTRNHALNRILQALRDEPFLFDEWIADSKTEAGIRRFPPAKRGNDD